MQAGPGSSLLWKMSGEWFTPPSSSLDEMMVNLGSCRPNHPRLGRGSCLVCKAASLQEPRVFEAIWVILMWVKCGRDCFYSILNTQKGKLVSWPLFNRFTPLITPPFSTLIFKDSTAVLSHDGCSEWLLLLLSIFSPFCLMTVFGSGGAVLHLIQRIDKSCKYQERAFSSL